MRIDIEYSDAGRFDTESYSEVALLVQFSGGWYIADLVPGQDMYISRHVWGKDESHSVIIKRIHRDEDDPSMFQMFQFAESLDNNNNAEARITQQWIWRVGQAYDDFKGAVAPHWVQILN